MTDSIIKYMDRLGRRVVAAVEETGYAIALFLEGLYWLFLGWRRQQPVKSTQIFVQMMQIGIHALPIVTILSFTIGLMLAIQGISTLKTFGAESQVVLGIAVSVTREFSPLITGILIAGRSGSALAARTGTMQISQEVDALRVIGISPVRYLLSPALLALLIMLPLLTFYADIISLAGGAMYTHFELGMGFYAYFDRTMEILAIDDVMQGIWKSMVFGIIITMISFMNGFSVTAGAEGVGRATTRSVVLSISYIIIADMIFTYLTI